MLLPIGSSSELFTHPPPLFPTSRLYNIRPYQCKDKVGFKRWVWTCDELSMPHTERSCNHVFFYLAGDVSDGAPTSPEDPGRQRVQCRPPGHHRRQVCVRESERRDALDELFHGETLCFPLLDVWVRAWRCAPSTASSWRTSWACAAVFWASWTFAPSPSGARRAGCLP